MQGRNIHSLQAMQLYQNKGYVLIISHPYSEYYDETTGIMRYQMHPGDNTVQVDSGTGRVSPVPPPSPMAIPSPPAFYPDYPWPPVPVDIVLPALDESATYEYVVQCYCYGEAIRVLQKEGDVVMRTFAAEGDYIYLRSTGYNWLEINTAIVP